MSVWITGEICYEYVYVYMIERIKNLAYDLFLIFIMDIIY